MFKSLTDALRKLDAQAEDREKTKEMKVQLDSL